MSRWSKSAKDFTVSVHYDNEKGSQIRVPKPILERLGNPKQITFAMNVAGQIFIKAVNDRRTD